MLILAQTYSSGPLEWLARLLGSWFGNAVGQVVFILVNLLIFFLIWGLPWLRIISRIGFRGRLRRWLFGLLFFPILLIGAIQQYAQTSVVEFLAGIAGLALYGAFLVVAFLPLKEVKH